MAALPRLGSVRWVEVLTRLGVPPGTEALPAVTECPRCRGCRLYTLQDNLFGGEWHSCRDCGVAGSPVALAAAVWECSVADAAASLGLDAADIAEYAAVHPDVGAALRAADLGTGRARSLAGRLGLTSGHWADRLGRFVIPADRVAVDLACRAGAPRYSRSPLRPDWSDLLVVPFEDVPGRVVAAWVVNPDDGAAGYLPVRSVERQQESGLGFLGALSGGPDPEFDQTAFLVTDPLLVVHLQDRRFRLSARPLPAAACLPVAGRHARSTDVLYGRRPVVWGRRITRELVRQARVVNGRVAGPVWGADPLKALENTGPVTMLRRVEEKAVLWVEALAALLADLPPAEADETLRFVNPEEDGLHRLATLGGAAAAAVSRADGGDPSATLTVRDPSGNRLIERDGCWYSVPPSGRPRLVTDAPFRVRQAIRLTDRGNEVHYRVVARYRDRDVEFVVPADEFDAAPFARVRSEVVRAGAGVPIYSRYLCGGVAAAARRVHEPEQVTSSDRCGWNEIRAAWVFPRFSIGVKGDIGPGTLLPPDGRTPAAAVGPPAALTTAAVAALGAGGLTAAVAWAVAGCVLSNLTAPAVTRRTSGIALVGAGACDTGWTVGRLIGCSDTTVDWARSADYGVARCRAAETAHAWPILIRSSRHRCQGLPDLPGDRNLLTQMTPLGAAAIGFDGGWHAVRQAGRCRLPSRALADALSGLVPNFLQWFAANGMKLESGVHGEAVFSALAEWYHAAGGDRSAVQSGADLVVFDRDGEDAETWVRHLIRAVDELAPRNASTGGARVLAPAGPSRVTVRYHAIAFWAGRRAIAPPPPEAVYEAMEAARAIRTGGTDAKPEWEIDLTWLG